MDTSAADRLAVATEDASVAEASEVSAASVAAMSARQSMEGQRRTPQLSLDGFTGPLERLLTLARAHQIDLARLSLGMLVDQLAAALRHAPTPTPLGEKGDWVVMAAWLVQLRSVLLLPAEAPTRQEAAVEADQLRARLIGLHAMQALAGWLDRRPQLGRDVFARSRPEVFGVVSETVPVLDVIEFLWSSLALFDDDAPATDSVPVYQPQRFALYTVAAAHSAATRGGSRGWTARSLPAGSHRHRRVRFPAATAAALGLEQHVRRQAGIDQAGRCGPGTGGLPALHSRQCSHPLGRCQRVSDRERRVC